MSTGAHTVPSERDAVLDVARRARGASTVLAPATRAAKDAAIVAMADALDARVGEVVAANAVDVDRAKAAGTDAGLVDRLTLTRERIVAIAEALRDVAKLPDPVGEVIRGFTLPNGLEVRQVRVPMGVVGIIYEARPNVTVDAAGLGAEVGQRRAAARVIIGVRIELGAGRHHAGRPRGVRSAARLHPAGPRHDS